MNKNSIIILVVILVLAAVLALVYFNRTKQTPGPAATTPTESSTASPSPVGNNIVTIQNFAFNPPVLEIRAGQKVIWKHNDAVTHRVVSLDNLFDSGEMNRGNEFSFVFNKAGEYNYHCSIHPSMTGKIIVK